MNAYLIIGDSQYLINDEIDKINKNNFIINKFDLTEVELSDIIDDASYLTLFDEKKLIVIKNAIIFNTNNLTEKDYKRLITFLENTDNILVFVTDKINNKKRIVKYFNDKNRIITLKKFYEKDLINVVISAFKKENKYIDYNSSQYIVRSCLLNYDLIMKEIEKIIIYYDSDNNIKYDDVVSLVSKTLDDNVYNFTNSVIEKNKERAFRLFDELMLFNVDSVYLIGILAKQYRNMYKTKCFIDDKLSEKEISSKISLSGYAFTKVVENSYNYSKEELRDLIYNLSKIDVSLKKGLVNKDAILNNFLLNI